MTNSRSESRSPEEIQQLMWQGFLSYVDQLHRDRPDSSYGYCFVFALRAMHHGAHNGDMTDAPPLPGSVPAEEVFGLAGAQVESALARLHPDKSRHWHREMAERILLGDDGDDVPEWRGLGRDD